MDSKEELTDEQVMLWFFGCYISAYFVALSQCVPYDPDPRRHTLPPAEPIEVREVQPPVLRENVDTPVVDNGSQNTLQDFHKEEMSNTSLPSEKVNAEPKTDAISVSNQTNTEEKTNAVSVSEQPKEEKQIEATPVSTQPREDVTPVPAQPTEEEQVKPDDVNMSKNRVKRMNRLVPLASKKYQYRRV